MRVRIPPGAPFIYERYDTMREHKGKSIVEIRSQFVVVDIETTGLDPKRNNIIEIGAIKYKHFRPIDEFQLLVKPPEHTNRKYKFVSKEITELTGITDDMLSCALDIFQVYPKFEEFLSSQIILGHNVNFDINFLYDSGMKVTQNPLSNNYIDTLRISRKYLPELAHHTLTDISNRLGVVNKRAHRALTDCYATAECYIKLCEIMKFDMQV